MIDLPGILPPTQVFISAPRFGDCHHIGKMKIFGLVALLDLLGWVHACGFHGLPGIERPRDTRRFPPKQQTTTLITDVSVFDGKVFGPPQHVCLDDSYIWPSDRCLHSKTTVSGKGKFLIPGLIDSHVHLTDMESLENFTSYGCTTALQMNCLNYKQCDLLAKQSGLASFFRSGMAAIGNGSLHQKQESTRPPGTFIYPDTNVTQYTEWQFKNGSNFHKMVAEVNGPSLAQQVEMIKTAHSVYRKPVMTHASDIMAYRQAIQSRTDGIQHVPSDGLLDDELIDQILQNGQFVTPTINIFEYIFNVPILHPLFGILPGTNKSLTLVKQNVRRLREAGVPMIAGTDSIGPLPINGTIVSIPFGLSLHYELEHLVSIAGASPAEAINMATRHAAKWHRLCDRGSIEVGKRADLVLLNSNPLKDIKNTRDIDQIWVGGVSVALVAKPT